MQGDDKPSVSCRVSVPFGITAYLERLDVCSAPSTQIRSRGLMLDAEKLHHELSEQCLVRRSGLVSG